MDPINDNNIKQITTPAEAVEQFVGEQFIEWLMNYVAHEMLSWPQIKKIQTAKPKIEKIRKFILQRYLAAEAFAGGREGDPGFLGFAIANLSESADPEAEAALEILSKKAEEGLAGSSLAPELKKHQHKELWIRLLKALGSVAEEIERAEPKEPTRDYVAELSDLYSNGEWPEVVGAFAAHDRAIPEEYRIIVEMLKNNTVLSPQDYEVLAGRSGADVKYAGSSGHILEKVVFDRENKQLVWKGATRELEAKKQFYAALAKYLEN